VLGGEAAEKFGDVFVRVFGAHGLLLGRGHLGHGMLADGLVRWPMLFLALGGLSGLLIDQLSVPKGIMKRDTHAVICGHLYDVRDIKVSVQVGKGNRKDV